MSDPTDPGQLAVGVAEGWIRPPLHQRSIGEGMPVRSKHRVLDLLADDRGD
jgi:hypothetical protein